MPIPLPSHTFHSSSCHHRLLYLIRHAIFVIAQYHALFAALNWGVQTCNYVLADFSPGFTEVLQVLPYWRLLLHTITCYDTCCLYAVTLGLFVVWYQYIYKLPKREYNRVHPYTSWIPITLWVVLRNVTPAMRHFSLSLYGWLGCITLETYISQFHTWLATGVPNGQPKMLLTFFPANYPLLNFAASTAGMLACWCKLHMFAQTTLLGSTMSLLP